MRVGSAVAPKPPRPPCVRVLRCSRGQRLQHAIQAEGRRCGTERQEARQSGRLPGSCRQGRWAEGRWAVGRWATGRRRRGHRDDEHACSAAPGRRRRGGPSSAQATAPPQKPPYSRGPRGSSAALSTRLLPSHLRDPASREPARRRTQAARLGSQLWPRKRGAAGCAAQAGSGRSKGGLLARAALPPVLPVVAAYRTRAGVINSTVGWLARAALHAALPASLRGSWGEI